MLNVLTLPLDRPTNCTAIPCLATDSAMHWRCQSANVRSCSSQHIACVPATAVASRGLVVFLPGTGLTPHDYSALVADFSLHGFHSLGLFYPSGEGQNGCGRSRTAAPTDLNCTARERARVLTGDATHGPTSTNITFPDSIVSRVSTALRFLGAPWSGYLDSATQRPRWRDVIIAGHSNGADHAAFLAKSFRVSRALLFSGPNDYVGESKYGTYSSPAPWQFAAGATPASELYGFGLCGHLPSGGAMPECFDWQAGWGAQGLPNPWLRVDSVMGDAAAMSGFHRLCSNGSRVTHGDMHMAAAADCCAPRRRDGRLLWTSVVEHMLADATVDPWVSRRGSFLASVGLRPAVLHVGAATNGTCACAWSHRGVWTLDRERSGGGSSPGDRFSTPTLAMGG